MGVIKSVIIIIHHTFLCSFTFSNQRSVGCPERREPMGRRVGWASVSSLYTTYQPIFSLIHKEALTHKRLGFDQIKLSNYFRFFKMVARATPSEASPAPATGSAEAVSPVFGDVPSFFVSVSCV